MMFLLILLALIFFVWKLFVDGWLFRLILFGAGWFGLYFGLHFFTIWGNQCPMMLGDSNVSWAILVPTIVCFLSLLTTKTNA